MLVTSGWDAPFRLVCSGLQSLKVLLSVGTDIEEFLPQILCRLATIALVAKEEPVHACPASCSAQL